MPVHKTNDLDHKVESESTAVGALQTASNEALRLALKRATSRATATQQRRSSETPEASTRIVRAARKAALDAMRRMATCHEESLDDRGRLLDATAPKAEYTEPATRPSSLSPEPEHDVEWESAWAEEGHHRFSLNDRDENLEVVVEYSESQPEDPHEVISVNESSSDTDQVESPRNPQHRQRRKYTKVKRTFSAAERATALRIHRIHLLSMLASALYFDQLADAALIQGRALSLVPLDIAERFDFIQKRPLKDRGMAFIDALTCFLLWFASNYRISSIPCDCCQLTGPGQGVRIPRTPSSRLDHAMLHGCGGEEELIALASAMLRALLRYPDEKASGANDTVRQCCQQGPHVLSLGSGRRLMVRFVACPNLINRRPEGLFHADRWASLPSWRARLAALLTQWYGPESEPDSRDTAKPFVQPPLNRNRPGKPLGAGSHPGPARHPKRVLGRPSTKSDRSTSQESFETRNHRAGMRIRKRELDSENGESKALSTEQHVNRRNRSRKASGIHQSDEPITNERETRIHPSAGAAAAQSLQNIPDAVPYWQYRLSQSFLAPWRARTGVAEGVDAETTRSVRMEDVKNACQTKCAFYTIRGRWPLEDAALYRVPQYWLEVWDPWQERWVHLDPLRCLLNDPLAVTVLPWWTAVERPAPQPERLDTNVASGDERKELIAKSGSIAGASVRGRASDRLRSRQALLSPGPRPRDSANTHSTDKSTDASSSGQESDASEPVTFNSLVTNVKRSARQRVERVVSYIFAIEGGFVRDVTRRYVARFQPVLEARSLDGHRYWTEEVLPILNPYRPGFRPDSENDDDELQQERLRSWCHLDALEREEFLTLNESEPIPQSLSALKNHPAFVLEEHLKKYEALYPKVEVGTIRRIHSNGILQTIPVYRRRDVHVLHTRERWFRECRLVRPDEQPYKVVQSFMSRFRQRREERRRARKRLPEAENDEPTEPSAGPTELFGFWQTDPMPRPKAENGIVPRCGLRGNIELWTPEHLPLGTTHVDLPFAAMFSRRLGFDFVPAMVGFEVRACGFVPAIRGVVVCTENASALVDACRAEIKKRQERAEKRSREEAMRRWRQLIRTIVAKERLRKRYGGFQVADTNADFSSRKVGKAATGPSSQSQSGRAQVATAIATAAGAASATKDIAAHDHQWVLVDDSTTKSDLGRKRCTICDLCVTYESLV